MHVCKPGGGLLRPNRQPCAPPATQCPLGTLPLCLPAPVSEGAHQLVSKLALQGLHASLLRAEVMRLATADGRPVQSLTLHCSSGTPFACCARAYSRCRAAGGGGAAGVGGGPGGDGGRRRRAPRRPRRRGRRVVGARPAAQHVRKVRVRVQTKQGQC